MAFQGSFTLGESFESELLVNKKRLVYMDTGLCDRNTLVIALNMLYQ